MTRETMRATARAALAAAGLALSAPGAGLAETSANTSAETSADRSANASPRLAVDLGDGVVLRLATLAEARAILGREDGYVRRMTPLDRKMFGGAAGSGAAAVLRGLAEQARPWSREDVEKLRAPLEAVAATVRGAGLALDLPKEMLLIRAPSDLTPPHTRAGAIILTRDFLDRRSLFGAVTRRSPAEWVLYHEIWHVFSRANPHRREALYALTGFAPCPPFDWPPALEARRVTNPDAPAEAYCLTIEPSPGREALVTTFIYGRDLRPGEPAARSRFYRRTLIELDIDGARARVARDENGRFRLHSTLSEAYVRKVGARSPNNYEPEEILADAFMIMMLGDAQPRLREILPRRALVAALRRALAKPD